MIIRFVHLIDYLINPPALETLTFLEKLFRISALVTMIVMLCIVFAVLTTAGLAIYLKAS